MPYSECVLTHISHFFTLYIVLEQFPNSIIDEIKV